MYACRSSSQKGSWKVQLVRLHGIHMLISPLVLVPGSALVINLPWRKVSSHWSGCCSSFPSPWTPSNMAGDACCITASSLTLLGTASGSMLNPDATLHEEMVYSSMNIYSSKASVAHKVGEKCVYLLICIAGSSGCRLQMQTTGT